MPTEFQQYQNDINQLTDKDYRDSYLESQVRGGVAYQVRALRKKAGLSQKRFGDVVGKPQNVVSRLENAEYGSVTVQTLLDVAKGLGVAIIIKFASFPRFLDAYRDLSPEGLAVENIDETVTRLAFSNVIKKGLSTTVVTTTQSKWLNTAFHRVSALDLAAKTSTWSFPAYRMEAFLSKDSYRSPVVKIFTPQAAMAQNGR